MANKTEDMHRYATQLAQRAYDELKRTIGPGSNGKTVGKDWTRGKGKRPVTETIASDKKDQPLPLRD